MKRRWSYRRREIRRLVHSCGALLVILAVASPCHTADCVCAYSVGDPPKMTDWPEAVVVGPNNTYTFTASSTDSDAVENARCELFTFSDGATCVWTASDGTPLSGRGNSFTWQAPQLGANETVRRVTITVQADDNWTSNPCPCNGCDGNINDSPADAKTIEVTVCTGGPCPYNEGCPTCGKNLDKCVNPQTERCCGDDVINKATTGCCIVKEIQEDGSFELKETPYNLATQCCCQNTYIIADFPCP